MLHIIKFRVIMVRSRDIVPALGFVPPSDRFSLPFDNLQLNITFYVIGSWSWSVLNFDFLTFSHPEKCSLLLKG